MVLVAALAGLAGLLILAPRRAGGELHCVETGAEKLTFEQVIDQADLRVIGKVSGYRPQQGPYHDLKITVSTNLTDDRAPQPGQTVAIATDGNSPLDACPSPSRDPQIGRQVIVFAHREDLSMGGSTVRQGYRLTGLYVLLGDEIYRGGPDDETIGLEELLHRMQEIASAGFTPENAGIHLEDPPPGVTPPITLERAYALAAAQDGYAKTTPPEHRSGRFVLVTFAGHWKEPVWLLTFTGLHLDPMGCPNPGSRMGAATATPLPCGYNSEMNVMVSATTGEVIGGFSYR